MKRVKVWSNAGFVGSDREDVLEFEDDATADEINEDVLDWFWNHNEFGWEILEEDESDVSNN